MVKTLTREAVIRVIEGKGAAERIPLFYDFYIQGICGQSIPSIRNLPMRRIPGISTIFTTECRD